MAASGIAEHNEARRREMSMQRMAFRKKQLQSKLHEQYGDSYMSSNQIVDPNQDTYEQEVNQIRKVGSPPGIAGNFRRDPQYVDQWKLLTEKENLFLSKIDKDIKTHLQSAPKKGLFIIERQRREQLRQQQLVEYSAKIPNRFTSTHYIAQW